MKQLLLMPIISCSAFILIFTLAGCANHQGAADHSRSTHAENMEHGEMSERHVEVAELGETVMPFDLDATTHIFEKIENGGRQQVVTDDLADVGNIERIRSHLAEVAQRFAQGDFHDPQMIHGENMPGLHDLVMGVDRLAIEYSELPDGGQILYTTDDAGLIEAIHVWFDAQLSDHGQHAQGHK